MGIPWTGHLLRMQNAHDTIGISNPSLWSATNLASRKRAADVPHPLGKFGTIRFAPLERVREFLGHRGACNHDCLGFRQPTPPLVELLERHKNSYSVVRRILHLPSQELIVGAYKEDFPVALSRRFHAVMDESQAAGASIDADRDGRWQSFALQHIDDPVGLVLALIVGRSRDNDLAVVQSDRGKN